jgi:uncharacterized membrane protein
MAVGSVALFTLTMVPDTLAAYGIIHIPTWLTMGGIDDARAILGAMMGAVSTVLALIFSVALLVLSMVANLFGPRLLYRFVQDWVTQATIGLFMAAFIYVFLVFLVTHRDDNSTFVPQVSLITCWVLVLAAFAFLVFYSHRIAVSIQNPDAVARITDDIRNALSENAGLSIGERREAGPEAAGARQSEDGGDIFCEKSGYVQEIDHKSIVAKAVEAGAVLHFLFRPGQFVLAGERLAVVWPKAAQPRFAALLRDFVRIGRHRVLGQDAEFGVAQIVEVAIRALSPAVNDTFTGMACVDWIGEALLALNERPQPSAWHGPDGRLRLKAREVPMPRLIKLAFDQIRQASASNPAVLIRMLNMIGRLAPRLDNAPSRAGLLAQARAILETAMAGNPVSADRADVEAAFVFAITSLEEAHAIT